MSTQNQTENTSKLNNEELDQVSGGFAGGVRVASGDVNGIIRGGSGSDLDGGEGNDLFAGANRRPGGPNGYAKVEFE